MSVKKWVFDLDIKEKTKVPKMTLVRGDTNSNVFEITLTPNVDLTDTLVTLTFLKEDGNVVVGQANITDPKNGVISYTIKGNEISYPGSVTATVEVYNSEQTSRFTSTQFRFNVIEQLDNGQSIESTSEYTILTELINQIQPIIVTENERITNENERISNENTRQSNEENRQLKEQDRINNENTRQSNEEIRILNENNRILAEQERTQNEDIRKSNENTRQENESNRILKELDREKAELLREEAENERASNENERITNENERISNEIIRQENEENRVEAEYNRVLSESLREENENARQDAESLRVSKELERISAENERISNENARIEAENNRVLAETERANAEAIRIQNELERINAEAIREENEAARINAEIIREENEAKREQLKAALELLKDSLESGNFGDMFKSIYDKNNNGIVDNAEKVNNHTVESDVPKNAVFTDTVYDDTVLSNRVSDLEENKVDKIEGKGLSTEDYTTEEKQKLAGIEEGANKYIHPSTHPASMITESSTRRFVSDDEKNTWNTVADKADKSYVDVELNKKAEKTDIPTKVSQLENDMNYVTNEELGNAGYGDMLKSIYDTDNDGKVDRANNADKVNGHTVESDVPKNAVFTDTIYDDTLLTNRVSDLEANIESHKNDNTSHITSTERNTWNAKETPSGAQAKADTAETNAKNYADLVAGEIEDELESHKNDKVTHIDYAVASGTDTYTVNIQGITALVEGLSVKIKFQNANTEASTLNINGLGAKEIRKSNGNALSAGNIKAGQICHLVYTGSVFQLLGEGGEYGTAQPEHVLEGYTIGTDEGLKEGTMANRGSLSVTPSTSGKSYGGGYYSSIYVAGDSDLKSENIKSGKTIFGVSGKSSVVDTEDATAAASNILSGKTAYVDGSKLTGTMPSIGQQIITPGTTSKSISKGYHDGTGYVQGSANLKPENIKKGVNIFGVIGTLEEGGKFQSGTITNLEKKTYTFTMPFTLGIAIANVHASFGEDVAVCYRYRKRDGTVIMDFVDSSAVTIRFSGNNLLINVENSNYPSVQWSAYEFKL